MTHIALSFENNINIQPSTSRLSQRIMEKFLKGKTLYIEDSKDGRTLRFVIANITRCENGVLATSEENEQIFIGHQCFEDLKKQGWHRQHHYCGICASMTEISIGN